MARETRGQKVLEAFEVASIGGGTPVLMEGLCALKRTANEQARAKKAGSKTAGKAKKASKRSR